MSELLPYLVIGIVSGAIYGLSATGLVITYKTSGIFNFAHGSAAAVAAYVFYYLHVSHGMAWPLAFILSVGVLGPLMGLALERLARRLAGAPPVIKITAMAGLILIVEGVADIWYGTTSLPFPAFLPTESVTIAGAAVSYGQIIVLAIAIVGSFSLYGFFRKSRLGSAMRAVVDDPDLLDLGGISPTRVRAWSWVLGATFAALSGVLLAPTIGLDATIMTLVVVQAFGGAAVGYFSNLPLVFAGGVLIGVLASLSTWYSVTIPWMTGVPASLPFVVLIIALLITPRRLLREHGARTRILRQPLAAPARIRAGSIVALIAFLALVPLWAGTYLTSWTDFLTSAMLLLSLGMMVRTAGQVSLCHVGYAAIGAGVAANLASNQGVPWLVAIAIGVLVGGPVGGLVAIPTIRLSGTFLALATFGFGVLLEQLAYPNWLFGSSIVGVPLNRPHLSFIDVSSDTGFYYVVLIFAVSTSAVLVAFQGTRLGRLLRATSESPVALATQGASINVTRVLVAALAAAIAALAGALSASNTGFATGTSFSSLESLQLVVLVIIAGGRDPWYGLLGAAGLSLVPAYLSLTSLTDYLSILFGVSAIAVTALSAREESEPTWLRRWKAADRRRIEARRTARRERLIGSAKPTAALRPDGEHESGRSGLAVEGLGVRFGGIVAVDDVSLRVPVGRVTGLIGPNGAGKTTTFNACSGLLRPSAGRITLHGADFDHTSAAARARMGLGRTFQRFELWPSMTVREHVLLGREAQFAGLNPIAHVATRPRQRLALELAAQEAIALAGIGDILDVKVSGLSTGQRRLVELARCIAGGFDLLLLDEPSSGLDSAETEKLGEALRRLVDERGSGLLLVEHDMSLVHSICDYLYVMDFGRLIFEGPPDEAWQSSIVRSAYLGEDSSELGSQLDRAGQPSADAAPTGLKGA